VFLDEALGLVFDAKPGGRHFDFVGGNREQLGQGLEQLAFEVRQLGRHTSRSKKSTAMPMMKSTAQI
jgi:hypothetical protein